MGAATSASIANQPVLPSLHETDMTIQADPRVMRMTVGAVPNSSSAHGQVGFCREQVGFIEYYSLALSG